MVPVSKNGDMICNQVFFQGGIAKLSWRGGVSNMGVSVSLKRQSLG